ncbi:MAG: citrate transporter [Roseburia sp.]|nr:citrate transporter [Roseburia sp.]
MTFKEKCIHFIKQETVLAVATVLAVISAFFVAPSEAYLKYIDWRVLGILLSLMIIMAGLQKTGLFDSIGAKLLGKTSTTRQLAFILVFLCFFFSMLITNDVALFTFVPFAMIMLKKCKQEKLLIPVIVLQTIAANLGSMLTPIGNPQNLYLYNLSGMGMGEFIGVMLPYTIISGVLLCIGIVICCKKESITEVVIEPVQENWNREEENLSKEERKSLQEKASMKKGRNLIKNAVYITLFVLSLCVVVRLVPFEMVLLAVILLVFNMDRKVLMQVDYCLLLTFIAFFIFTGNMGNISVVRDTLQQLVAGKELAIGVISSQAISNVPAALLLSGFTSDYRELLIGVNLGGLGTLIASMASLISYKLFAKEYNDQKGKYFWWFTIANVVFLAVLAVAAIIL